MAPQVSGWHVVVATALFSGRFAARDQFLCFVSQVVFRNG